METCTLFTVCVKKKKKVSSLRTTWAHVLSTSVRQISAACTAARQLVLRVLVRTASERVELLTADSLLAVPYPIFLWTRACCAMQFHSFALPLGLTAALLAAFPVRTAERSAGQVVDCRLVHLLSL